jgi:hypothetical protein
MFFAALIAIGVFILRIVKESENLGDKLSYIFKLVPSYAISDGLLYSFNRNELNKTRNYTEADIFLADLKNYTLPLRTNISLASWDLPNIGGDLIALCGNAFVCTLLLVLIETGCFMWLARSCSNKQIKGESSDIESFKEFEEDVLRET